MHRKWENDIISQMQFFSRLGRAGQKTRRILAAVGAAFLLGVQVLSAAYVAHEADHDCSGEGCPICVQIQHCVANFQLTGTGTEADATTASLPITAADPIVPTEAVPTIRSLVAQKVQFNE